MATVHVWLLRDAEADREKQQQGSILTIWYGEQGSRITNEYLQLFPIFHQSSPIHPGSRDAFLHSRPLGAEPRREPERQFSKKTDGAVRESGRAMAGSYMGRQVGNNPKAASKTGPLGPRTKQRGPAILLPGFIP